MKKIIKSVLNFCHKNLTIIIILFVFLMLYVFDVGNFAFADSIINNFKAVSTSFSPQNGIFYKDENVSYVSYIFNMISPDKAVEFVLPTSSPCNIVDEYTFSYKGGLVFSCAGGIVKKVGYDNLQKYVEVGHTNGYVSKYYGIDFVGVCINETIKEKCALAFVDYEKEWSFQLFKNNEKVKLGDIEWQE